MTDPKKIAADLFLEVRLGIDTSTAKWQEKHGTKSIVDVIEQALIQYGNEKLEAAANQAETFIENHATHILHYHDKEGRTTEERVFHEARFKEISEVIRGLKSSAEEKV